MGCRLFSQVAPTKYYIQFTDKNNSPYSISNPLQYLSQRAIDRRAHHNVAITPQDFPVNPQYVQTVNQTASCNVLLQLRWMNGVVIQTTDTIGLNNIMALPFVDSLNSQRVSKNTAPTIDKFAFDTSNYELPSLKNTLTTTIDYGAAWTQNNMIHIDKIHELGFTGTNMRIAVLDAGFRGADSSDVLSHIWNNGKLIDQWDFVRNAPINYNTYSSHGTSVLKCMGANSPGYYVGSAPDAEYILLRTEDAPTENIIEEYNWAAGAEFADSAGADVFNTSLGYTTFDNPDYDHSYNDLDGNTTVITIAADIAASKGILVVNSAGNSGNNQWYYIGAPADGDSVLAIGAVSANRMVTSFSSRGPSADGRVKPNVMAQGGAVPIPNGMGGFDVINGTSFSGPILAGAAACLWESRSSYTNMEVFNAIEQSAHLFNSPNDEYGFGIPNMHMAYYYVTGVDDIDGIYFSKLHVYPNPASNKLFVNIANNEKVQVEIYNVLGKRMIFNTISVNQPIDISSLPNGVYLIRIGNLPTGRFIVAQ